MLTFEMMEIQELRSKHELLMMRIVLMTGRNYNSNCDHDFLLQNSDISCCVIFLSLLDIFVCLNKQYLLCIQFNRITYNIDFTFKSLGIVGKRIWEQENVENAQFHT